MTAALAALQAELAEVLATIQPVVEGLNDFSHLNLKPETLAAVKLSQEGHARLLFAIRHALNALEKLEIAGYPSPVSSGVPQALIDDLADQLHTINLAFSTFTAVAVREEATHGRIVPVEG